MMLISLNRMVGLPVVWQDRRVGYVERAVPDASAERLNGIVIRKGIGGAKWANADSVGVIGNQCVLLSRKPGAMPERTERMLTRVFLTTGQCVGEVTDAFMPQGTLHLAALEISPGPLYRLRGRCAYAVEYRVDTATNAGTVVAGKLLSWAQLKRTLGEEGDG